MSWAAKMALRSLLIFVATSLVAAEFPMPEAYAENELPRYMEAAAAFLNSSPESIYAPRVAFDALVVAKDNPKFLELRGDLEVSLIVDYPGSLHGGYYQRTLSDPKIAREVLQRIIRQYAKKPRQDFPKKYAEALSRFIEQCGIDLIDDVGFSLECLIAIEHSDAAQLREVIYQNISERLKSDDSVVDFVNEATNVLMSVADRLLVLHTYAQRQNRIAAVLRDLLLVRLTTEERNSTKIKFVRAEAFLEHSQPKKALVEYESVKPDEFGEKELWLRSWCAAQIEDVLGAKRHVNELKVRFPNSEYLNLASTVQECLSRVGLADDYAQALGRMIDCAAHQTDSFHVMVRRKPSEDKAECVVFLNYSSAQKEFSVLMSDAKGTVLAAFHSDSKEVLAYVEGWECIRRIEKPGFIPVPVLNLKLNEDGNSFDFRSRTVGFGVPIACPLLDVPWFVGARKQAEVVQHFKKLGMCFAPIEENSSGRALKCIWPSTAGPKANEWRLDVSHEGRLLKVEGMEKTWEIRSGIAINEPFSSPAWPSLPVRVEDELGGGFVDVFLKIFRALM